MQQILNPSQYLFQQLILQVLEHCKKVIKVAPFDTLNPQQILAKNNIKKQSIQPFHQYFLHGMTSSKARQISCTNYEKLIREKLIDLNSLPPQMLTGIISSCAGGGSTTGSSSMGSVSSNVIQGDQSVHVAKLVSVILLRTPQPISQFTMGLNYLLEGTKSKNYSTFHISLLQEVYQTILVNYRTPPIQRFLEHYINLIVNQVQFHYHQQNFQVPSKFPSVCLHQNKKGHGKYGLCFICSNKANNYDKTYGLPLCGIDCKERLHQLKEQSKVKYESFNTIQWLLDHLPTQNQAIYSILAREIPLINLTGDQIIIILKNLPSGYQSSIYAAGIFKNILLRYSYSPESSPQQLNVKKILEPIPYKTINDLIHVNLLQIVLLLHNSPPKNDKIHLVQIFGLIVKNPQMLFGIYEAYDCHLLQIDLLAQILNIVSQYAMINQFDSSKQIASSNCRIIGLDIMTSMAQTLMHQLAHQDYISSMKSIVSSNYLSFKQRLEDPSICSHQVKIKREISEFIQMFNKKPEKTVKKFKQKYPELENKQIAIILRQNCDFNSKLKKRNKINKQSLGQFFGSGAQFAIDIYLQFLYLIDYTGMDVDDVWRILLGFFTLPKQGQQFQRILNGLCKAFYNQAKLVSETAVYQFAFTAMMVQTSRNPNVHQSQKVDLQKFQSFCRTVEGGVDEARVARVYNRLIANPLQNPFYYNTDEMFKKKYLKWGEYKFVSKNTKKQENLADSRQLEESNVKKQDNEQDLQMPKQDSNISEKQAEQKSQSLQVSMQNSMLSQSQSSDFSAIANNSNIKIQGFQLPLQALKDNSEFWNRSSFAYCQVFLQYVWQYMFLSIVNKNNYKGALQFVVLYGKYQLPKLASGFFTALCRLSEKGFTVCRQFLFKIAIDFGNYIQNNQWAYLINIIYQLEQSISSSQKPNFTSSLLPQRSSDIIDKIFTKSQHLKPEKLKIFMEQLCKFSYQFMKDIKYNRQLFVLRHLTDVTQYNLNRLDKNLWQLLWPCLNRYFTQICMHPKRQISMAAIDSYKQLLIKIIRLEINQIPMAPMFEVYRFIFQRSNPLIRDLIVNILLNIVSSKVKDGWEVIYSILEHADCEDEKIVMKILGRIIDEAGLSNLPSLIKIHEILLRQLRLASQPTHIYDILNRVWQVSNFIDSLPVWLDTLRSVKDIFKKTLNNSLMNLFYLIANRGANQCQNNAAMQEIFTQVVDLWLFFIDIKDRKVLQQSLKQCFKINEKLIVNFLDGSFGVLSIWKLYLQSANRLIFCLHLKQYVPYLLQKLLSEEPFKKDPRTQSPRAKKKGIQTRQAKDIKIFCADSAYLVVSWYIKNFYQSCPDNLLQLTNLDPDFQIDYTTIKKNSEIKGQLIQFTLSQKDFHIKSMIHIILLDGLIEILSHEILNTIQTRIHQLLEMKTKQQQIKCLEKQCNQAILYSFNTAYDINKLVVLRYFLWKNNFLISNVNLRKASPEAMPGLHKQQIRSLNMILNNLSEQSAFIPAMKFLDIYVQKIAIAHTSLGTENSLYLFCQKDAKIWLQNSQKTLLNVLVWLKNKIKETELVAMNEQQKKKVFNQCLELSIKNVSKELLIAISNLIEALASFVI